MSLSQIELVWVRVEGECFWVNLTEDNRVSESKMAVSESNMPEFKMAIIIKLSQNEWVKFFCANGGNQSWQVWVRWQNPRWPNSRWLPSSGWVRMNELESDWISLSQSGGRVFLSESEKITRCLNPRWQCLNPTCQNSRWLPSSSWVRMNEWSFFLQMVGTNLGKCEWVWEEKLKN